MGLIIVSLVIVNLIALAIAMTENCWEGRKRNLSWLCPIFSVLILVAAGSAKWGSYASYVNLRAFYSATVEQYATAIEMYNDKAIIDVDSAVWTDLKYQMKDGNIYKIWSLRSAIIDYNTKLINKRQYHKNWFFSILIVPPDDDMKVISMKAAKDHKIEGSG